MDQIKNLNPCSEGWEWYVENKTDDLFELLINLNSYRSDWARWLFRRLMTEKQNVQIDIFSAKKVLSIFEKRYPDKRPRKLIEFAEAYLKNSNTTVNVTHDDAVNTIYAADQINSIDISAVNVPYAAAVNAAAAAYAAYASSYITATNTYVVTNDAVGYAYAAIDYFSKTIAAKKKVQYRIIQKHFIIHKAVEILEGATVQKEE